MKGRTYRYFTGQVLYPFGYGLTYGDVAVNRVVCGGSVFEGAQHRLCQLALYFRQKQIALVPGGIAVACIAFLSLQGLIRKQPGKWKRT